MDSGWAREPSGILRSLKRYFELLLGFSLKIVSFLWVLLIVIDAESQPSWRLYLPDRALSWEYPCRPVLSFYLYAGPSPFRSSFLLLCSRAQGLRELQILILGTSCPENTVSFNLLQAPQVTRLRSSLGFSWEADYPCQWRHGLNWVVGMPLALPSSGSHLSHFLLFPSFQPGRCSLSL